MPIIGLTDQQAALPIIGILRKGEVKKGNAPGRDLTYFRFTSDDADAQSVFNAAYPTEEALRCINVFLPHKTTRDNLDAWMEHWVAGGLVHRCDGRVTVLSKTSKGDYSTEPQVCPGQCKQVGRLSVIIPELGRFATVTVLTTSINDIRDLDRQLKSYEALNGDLRGIPFILSRKPRKISTPAQDGKRARREKWMLSIETKPEWSRLQLAATEQAALPESVEVIEGEWQAPQTLDLPANIMAPEEVETTTIRDTLIPVELIKHLKKKVVQSALVDAATKEPLPVNYHPNGASTAALVAQKFAEALDGNKEHYHLCLDAIFDKSSAKDLTAAEADALLDWLVNGTKDQGFKAQVKDPAPAEAKLILAMAADEEY